MANAAYIPGILVRDIKYYLRDKDSTLVTAWREEFKERRMIKVSQGDIFIGAPEVDAVVTPSNSFGFLNGGIDGACWNLYGQQLQNRLQNVIVTEYDGELLVGQAIIIPAYDQKEQESKGNNIKYVISAPTMRVTSDVSNTTNAYLCFRAILLAVHRHNRTAGNKPIKSVLVPGLGTGTGKMPGARCAYQMLQAYDTFVTEIYPSRVAPETFQSSSQDDERMRGYNGRVARCKAQ